MPIKSYFEEKISDLIKQFLGEKITPKTLWFLKISKNAISILVLEFQPESIEKWRFLKFQKNWKSLHPTKQGPSSLVGDTIELRIGVSTSSVRHGLALSHTPLELA